MDKFVAIANLKITKRDEIVERKPDRLSNRTLRLKKSKQSLVVPTEISTKNELYQLLEAEKKRYAPFLLDLKNVEEKGFVRTELNGFSVDGKIVNIPDYGGPTGNAKKTYVKTFNLNKKSDKFYRLFFNAVDYIANVYVNGECVGTHEGFFAKFWFDVTDYLVDGENTVKVTVFNDYTYLGNSKSLGGETIMGDKLYACTGPGWDDPYLGWHHCPAGFGILDKVFIDECEEVIVSDIFVRVKNDYSLEAWVEIYNFTYNAKPIDVSLDVFGQNFEGQVVDNLAYTPGKNEKIKNKHNLIKIPFSIKDAKIWSLSEPYLYKAVVTVRCDGLEKVAYKQFGVRTFVQDTVSIPKGRYYLNGKQIKLRGANTMGFEQQDVMNGDIDRLIDDILLAKICNMNFLRITQRPVQSEIYDYCDRLGLMVQTDLPLFGVMRNTKFAEGVRQAEEMEKHIRSHPCCIQSTFINEPFANGNGEPHRNMSRDEMEAFFDCCRKIIWHNNPERVIKSVDGDYDPPSKDLPDNHCYNYWYNNHAVLLGKMNRGYWLSIKPDWCYGCGEFGAEGLDYADLMLRKYPKEWVKKPFSPNNILYSQTGENGGIFYPKQNTMEDWVRVSQDYQAYAVKSQTEFFRRDRLNVSFAVHLFIDAWPAGWMKTIMDCERTPKKAYFAYRNALKPVIISLNTKKFTYYCGETVEIESFLCNDLNVSVNGLVKYALTDSKGNSIMYREKTARCGEVDSSFIHTIKFKAPTVTGREKFKLTAYFDDGVRFSVNELEFEVFEKIDFKVDEKIHIIPLTQRGITTVAGSKVEVYENSCAGGVFFVETPTNGLFDGILKKDDLRLLYNKEKGYIDDVSDSAIIAEDFIPLIVKQPYLPIRNCEEYLLMYKKVGDEIYVISSIFLREENPQIRLLLKAIHTRLKDYIK